MHPLPYLSSVGFHFVICLLSILSSLLFIYQCSNLCPENSLTLTSVGWPLVSGILEVGDVWDRQTKRVLGRQNWHVIEMAWCLKFDDVISILD